MLKVLPLVGRPTSDAQRARNDGASAVQEAERVGDEPRRGDRHRGAERETREIPEHVRASGGADGAGIV